MIILDPLQTNVISIVENLPSDVSKQRQIVGRLDLSILLSPSAVTDPGNPLLIPTIDCIFQVISTRFRPSDGEGKGFTGILLAGWEKFPLTVTHELCAILTTHELDVYLETSGPDFISDTSTLSCASIAGLVMRNALLRPNGDQLDCFDMEKLRVTVKAFVSQACLRSFAVLAWETLSDGESPSLAVLKRTYAWCSFYNVVPWIGSVKDTLELTTNHVDFQPLSAFDWLKIPHVMELHNTWRSLQIVSNPRPRSVNPNKLVL